MKQPQREKLTLELKKKMTTGSLKWLLMRHKMSNREMRAQSQTRHLKKFHDVHAGNVGGFFLYAAFCVGNALKLWSLSI